MHSTFRAFTFSLLFLFALSLTATRGAGCTTTDRRSDDTVTTATDSLAADSLAADTTGADAPTDIPLPERLKRLLDNPIFDRTQVGLYVWDLTADTLVFAHNERQSMRPASTEKLITTITAYRTLGTDYHYRTRFFADTIHRDSLVEGRITIEAGYDPLIDHSDLMAFADSLKTWGVTRIASPITLDLSFKDDKRLGWGWCWDDDEVPLTPLLYNNRDRFTEALREVIRQEGITWDGTVTEGEREHESQFCCERNHTIDQVVLPMMKESNNSMAESLFYQLARFGGNRRAGRKQAVRRINALVSEVDLSPAHYQFADGSGLSLYNYATPQLLGRLLRFAYRDEGIYRHLLPALPIAGEDGTLRRRMRGTAAAGNVKAKTGTVEGVSTLAGYLTTAGGNRLCFAIMNQGLRYGATGRNFQDRVCKALCR